MRRRLSTRLLISNVVVAGVAATVLFATALVLGPRLFDTEVQRIGQRAGWGDEATSPGGGGPGGRVGGSGNAGQAVAVEDELNAAFSDSLTVALIVALGVGAVAAVAGAALISRRVLRPLDGVRAAVRRMAEGHYEERVPEPPDVELAELAGDVNALGETLETTEQRRVRLVSDLAHELRTPITSLGGFVEGLEDGVFDATPETLGAMRSETRRLQRLAADLGALSRTDEQAFELELRDADLSVIAGEAARGLAASYGVSGVELVVTEMPALPVRADPDRMAQVFSNLLHNALRATRTGGRVTVAGSQVGNEALVTVSDTGDGIAPEHLGRVFDRFFRVEGASPASGGAGIGLTIARGITQAHGGDLTAASEGPGRGARFTVAVPLAG
jgi:signal transduction histidine kinase